LAWQEIDDDRCPGCGNPLTATTDFELRTEWQVERVSCHACRAKAAEAQEVEPGVFLVVTPRSDRVV
jgi:hypothetical protein